MFIPNDKFKMGDRVRLREMMVVIDGVYTSGHEFTITDIGQRGILLEDDDGRELDLDGTECFSHIIKIEPSENK